uniref:THAP domain-containing protein 6-like n=1 Tax=Myxine glutinosa TaxID=7769 RepID=UPI00358DE09B
KRRNAAICAAYAYGCTNKRTLESRDKGITFHKFPSDAHQKRLWEVALKREGFKATKYSVLCSDHFESENFDRTGQIVRLRDGVTPSVFNFPSHLFKEPKKLRTTSTSRQAAVVCDQIGSFVEAECDNQGSSASSHSEDHGYALPSSLDNLKDKLMVAEARVEQLQRELRNAKDREKRSKKTYFKQRKKKKTIFFSDLQRGNLRKVHGKNLHFKGH